MTKPERRLVPFNVVGILREKCRQQDATIAALRAENQGKDVEIAQLRAALEGRRGTSIGDASNNMLSSR